MKLTSTQKIIAVVVGAVVVLALAVFLLIVPQFSKLSRIGQQINQAEADMASAQTLLAQRQQIKQQAATTEAESLRLSNELPESPELPSFIMELQDCVNASGLEFSILEPSEPEERTGYQAIPMKVTVRGRWQDIVDFLSRVRRIDRQVRVLGFTVDPLPQDITATSTVDAGVTLESVLDVEIYTIAATSSKSKVPAAPSGQ